MKKEHIFAREAQIQLLEKRLRDLKDGYRQNIALVGDELVGKSSIIFKVLDRFSDNRIITLYLECRLESIDVFAHRFIGILLYNFMQNSGLPLKEDLEFLITKSERYIPRTTARIKFILAALKKHKRNELFTDLLGLCELIYEETGKSCVVIFDEFHNLEGMGISGLYREWSKLLIQQKHIMYIIISSAKSRARAILSTNLSLLFGNFEVMEVGPFDNKAAEDYLKMRLAGLEIEKGMIDFVIHFTGGYPFYLGLIADTFLQGSPSSITDRLEQMLFSPEGILNQRFSNYLKRFHDHNHRQDYLSILYLVSSGSNKINDIAHLLHKSKKELLQRISYLVEIDALTRSADFLSLNDRIFSFWLNFVYQGKINSLTFDARTQRVIFRDKINNMIQDFQAYCTRPIADRLTELLRLFDDEMIRIDKKKIRLDHLREIKALNFGTSDLRCGIIGRSSDCLWIMGFKNDLLTEDDVADFARECRRYRSKLQKKVLIALEDIDSNARLRALEEKILTWDLNNLNQLLDAFSKPRIIVHK